jgi:hypothetical protein
MESSSQWKEDEVISLLEVPEAALRLKGLDYDFHAQIYRQSMEMDIKSLESTINALRSPSLRQIAGTESTLDSQRWRDILHDYEHLLEKAMRNSHSFEAYEARCLNRFGLMVSTKSASLAESVGRISILAFIFVPLSFITSFFGMNTIEFGSGSVRLWTFIVSATALMLTVFVAWLLSSWIAGLINDLRENFYGFKIRIGVLRKFAVVSPLNALLLAWFSLTHRPRQFQRYLLHLGIWCVLGLGDDWDEPQFGPEQQQTLALSQFWITRGLEITKITGKRGWQNSSFYSRWRARRNQQSSTTSAGSSNSSQGN